MYSKKYSASLTVRAGVAGAVRATRATRAVRFSCLACVGSLLFLSAAAAQAFDFDDVLKQAQALASKSYKKPVDNLPKKIKALNYEQYSDISYRPQKNVWRGDKLRFELAFAHQGAAYSLPVKINEVAGRSVREIQFNPDAFDYGISKIDPNEVRGLGFAGFRVQYALNGNKDDVLSMLGASYFRALAQGQNFGEAARGLAIDTAQSSGEEFPRFVEFWIVRPSAADRALTIYALLDSSSLSGAYRFIVKPGRDTVVEVKAQLFLRNEVSKLGMAPLTSMFYSGENQRAEVDDYRPEVHDSDGLLVHADSGEWIWRPLVNPKRLLISSFALSNPRGFGLMQRDRQFASYQDANAHFETRPSVWIEPQGKWGDGRVELVQIPTPNEDNNNIVAYWVPTAMPSRGKPVLIDYRMLWQNETRPPLAVVTQTLRGNGNLLKPDESVLLVVDFEGAGLKKLGAAAKVSALIESDDNGKLLETHISRNDATKGWRMTLRLRRNEENKPVELRAFLRNGKTTLSETWSYLLPPN